MSILKKIVNSKQKELLKQKEKHSISFLEKQKYFLREPISIKKHIQNKLGIISEFKRKSPSKGIINSHSKVIDVAQQYEKAGVSALSILTNTKYFGGTINDIISVRDTVNIPILRKEFIIDEYQIIETKAIGADAILLIASILTKKQIINFSKIAKSLKLEVLLEIHNENELIKINNYIDCIGINNRNLNNFTVNINNSINLANKIPDNFIKISESGISSIDVIKKLKVYNFKGFLIGENFMKTQNPGNACYNFLNQLKK